MHLFPTARLSLPLVPSMRALIVHYGRCAQVGQVVGQLAKIKGCRAIGIAGGPAKCAFCTDELGFDACVDYKAAGLPAALAAACPSGIDVYFENVGGAVLEAVLPLLTPGCRVPVCGWVSAYNDEANNVSRAEQAGTPLVRLAEHGLVESGAPGLGAGAKIAPGGYRFFSCAPPLGCFNTIAQP